MKSIVLTGGGTIGHTAPHFAIIPKLNFNKIYYIGSKGGIEESYVTERGLEFYGINPVKLHRRMTLKNLQIPFKFIKSVCESKSILSKLKPSVVFSKGGFVALPVTIAAKQLNIPVIIHESDLSIGLANKIASKFSDKTLTTFDKTATEIKNGKYVGALIREELLSSDKNSAFLKYGIKTNKPILLITGGSSGAKAINQVVLSSLECLTKNFFVFHIVGKNNLTYKKINNYYETEFTDMKFAYKIADVVISRAGSNTAFELALMKLPTLFIPLPKTSSRGDQIENANYFKQLNLADVLLQENLTSQVLCEKINLLYKNKELYLNSLKNVNLKIANQEVAEILNKYWQL